jgi:hypothetical protein
METNPLAANSANRVVSYDDNGSSPGAFPNNPFVGLRPFRSDEGLLFFGRREQTLELLQQLQQSRFLSVVGSSGCGKSSLIRAGLIPKLEAGFLVEQRDQWRIATAKPGDAPLNNLAQSLIKTFADAREAADVATLVEDMRTVCAQAVVDFLTPRLKESDANMLLLVDQFEELFNFGRYAQRETSAAEDTESKETQLAERLDRERRREEAADFVSIMLGLAAQSKLPVYVVMTMRSDFLGDCDVFFGLPEAINVSQYLVPRLARPQRQEAIENPIVLYGQAIAPRLLDRILNDAGEEGDQLPVMQHVMMRTWEKWQATKDPAIDLPHYEAAGTMKQALSNDADEALSGMSAEDRTITKKLFQALTDTDSRGRRIRRPTHLKEIEAITGASREKLLEIISHFSGHGRSFLHLSQEEPDPLVDISHESLIRQWATLRDWVTKESRSKDIYLRLVGTASRYYKPEREDDLLRGAALQLALEWKEKRKPNQAWANRYHPSLDQALRFLEESKAERDRELVEAEQRRNEAAERERRDLEQALALAREREAAARWQRGAIYVLGFLLILAVGTTAWAVTAGFRAEKRKRQALAAEKIANDLTDQLKGNVKELDLRVASEKKLKDELAGKLDNEKKLKVEAENLRDEAHKQAAIASRAAARATTEAINARRAAQRERDALIGLKDANALAEEKANEAVEARVKAAATQSANQTFREGLVLARINNPNQAEKKYQDAIEAYKSLTDRDYEGEGTILLELADMYLRSEDPALFDKGAASLESAENVFKLIEQTKPVESNNGRAAVTLKMLDYILSERYVQELSPEEAAELTLFADYGLEEAYNFYDKAKNREGLAFTVEKLAERLRTSSAPAQLHMLITGYENLLQYHTERKDAAERVSLYLKIADLHKRLGETAEANTNFDSARKVFQAYTDPEAKEGEARASVDLGFVRGTDQDIASNNEAALQIIKTDARALANTLRHIGNKYQERWRKGPMSRPGFESEPAKAADYYSRAVALFRQQLPDTRIDLADTLTELGIINLEINRTAALQNFDEALRSYTENENAKMGSLLLKIAQLQEEKGQLDEALKSYEAAETRLNREDVIVDGLKAKAGARRVKAAMDKKTARP